MGKGIYSPKEKFHRWLRFGVLLSMVPVGFGIFLDFIRLDYDFLAACEVHLFDFVLMVFAISASLLEMSLDLERKMDDKVRHKYIGWAGIPGVICLIVFDTFYMRQNTLIGKGKIIVSIMTTGICAICIVCGRSMLYVYPTKKAKSGTKPQKIHPPKTAILNSEKR